MIALIAIVFLCAVWWVLDEYFGCTHHASARTPIGGFRCPDCGKIGQSLDEMGFEFGHISLANPLLQRTRQRPS